MGASFANEMTMAAGGDIEMGIMSFWDTKPGTVELPNGDPTAAGMQPGADSAVEVQGSQQARPALMSQADEQRLMCGLLLLLWMYIEMRLSVTGMHACRGLPDTLVPHGPPSGL